MVRSLFRFIHREVANLHAAAYTIAILTLFAQLLALVRDRVFASVFGAGQMLDVYYAAFRIPDLLFALIASLVSAYILIPLIARFREESVRHARALLSDAISFLIATLALVSVVAAVFMEEFLTLLYPSFMDSEYREEFVLVTRILLLQPFLLGISNIISSVTQIERRFFLYALSPVLYNLGIICGVFFFEPIFGLAGLAYGVLLGAFLHLIIHIPVVMRAKLMPYPTIPKFSRIREIVVHSFPRSLALSLNTFILMAVTILAAPLAAGSITIFTFAHNLQAIPLALIGASYAVVAFPTLATLYAAAEKEKFVLRVADAARHLILWSMFALVMFVVLRAHIVRAVLGTGEFTWDDTRLTAAVLAILVTALVSQALILLIARAYYAAGKTLLPLLIQGVGAVISVAGAFILLEAYYQYAGFQYFIESILRISFVLNTEIVAIALGVALGQFLAGVLGVVLFSSAYPAFFKKIGPVILHGFSAAVIGGAVAYATLSLLGGIFALTSLLAVLAQGALAGTLGLMAFLLVLAALSNQEFREIRAGLKNLTRKKLDPQSEF